MAEQQHAPAEGAGEQQRQQPQLERAPRAAEGEQRHPDERRSGQPRRARQNEPEHGVGRAEGRRAEEPQPRHRPPREPRRRQQQQIVRRTVHQRRKVPVDHHAGHPLFRAVSIPQLGRGKRTIEINENTGEVFIGSDKGLVSYKGEATKGKDDYSDVYAYPNPVRPEYRDKVTITGLMDNSIVKITDLNGNLVYQTKSLGGQAIWNCRNTKGVRVASGVYLVLSATEDSKESVVTKIAVIK